MSGPGDAVALREIADLVGLLRRRAIETPDELLFTFLGDSGSEVESTLTCAELDRRAAAISACLRERSLAGSAAILLYPPGLEFIAAFFGCLYAGVIAVPAYLPRPNRPATRLRSIISDSTPAAVLTCRSQAHRLDRCAAELPELQALARLITDEVSMVDGSASCGPPHPRTDSHTPALIQYTSGSTGNPKGVVLTHANLIENSRLIQDCFGSTAASRGVFWLPLFHDMGLIGGVIQTLFCGGRSTLLSPVAFLQRPARWLEAIARTRASISGGPNFAYDLCVDKTTPEQRAALDLSCWEVAFNGAEPIRHATLERFAEAFAPAGFRREAFTPCYGLAEATLFVSGTPCGVPPATLVVEATALERGEVVEARREGEARVLVSSGKPGAGMSVLAVDPEAARPCPGGQVGELWVAGGSVAAGYWGDRESERAFDALLPGWSSTRFLRTGDLGFLHEGELFVTGRSKDLLIIRGRNIYPQDVEWTVERSHPRSRTGGVAAFGVEMEGQERLVVVQEIERTRDPQAIRDTLAAIRQAIAEHHEVAVQAIVLIAPHGLPRTSSGKLQRHQCRSAYLEGAFQPIAAWNARPAEGERSEGPPAGSFSPAAPVGLQRTRDEIKRWLTDRLCETAGIDRSDVDPRQPFAAFGISSVQAVGLAAELERWMGEPLSPALIYEHPTINALADHLAANARRPGEAAGTRVGPGLMLSTEPVAIVGMACRFPGAEDPEAFWRLLREGRSGVGSVPEARWSADLSRSREIPHHGGFLEDVAGFDPQFFGISPREAQLIDPQQRLLLELTWEAIEDAGLIASRLAGSRVGVFVGIATSDYAQMQAMRAAPGDPHRITGSAASIAANRVSYAFDFRGPSLAIDTACSSSLVAVHLASRSLLEGESSLAVAGGVNAILAPEIAENFARVGFLSSDGQCRAFDERADGYVRGEGAGLVILKRLSDAVADGDRILALIRGSAVNQDGRSNGLTAPSRASQEAVLREAYRRAGISPGDVGYVEAHGTGTQLGDPIEAAALGTVLSQGRDPARPCALGSVKTNLGHLEAAAGIAGLIKATLILGHREIPPSLNYTRANPHIPFDSLGIRVQQTLGAWPRTEGPALAGVSSFGFGGTNAHVVLEEPPAPLRTPDATIDCEPPYLVPLSARSPQALRDRARAVRDTLARDPSRIRLVDLAHTLAVRRDRLDERLAFLASDVAEVIGQLDRYLEGSHPADLWTGRLAPSTDRKLAFVFSGQGGLAPRVGRDLLESEPVFRASFEECARRLASHGAAFASDAAPAILEAAEGSRTRDPTFEQPLQFALQVALAALLRSWGVVPDRVVGHSLGEIAAAHVAGALSLDEAARIVALRGRAMRPAVGRGATLAVALPAEDVRSRLSGHPGLVLSTINGPQAVTVSGRPEVVRAFADSLARESIQVHRLETPLAFHGPQMTRPARELREGLADLRPRPAGIEFISSVTGSEIAGERLDRDYWARNLRDPVQFVSAMETLSAGGVDAVVELGPHPILSAAMAACLGSPSPVVLGTLRRDGSGRTHLLRTLAGLFSLGFELDWERFSPPGRLIPLPSYPWQRRPYWIPDGADGERSTQSPPGGRPIVRPERREVVGLREDTQVDQRSGSEMLWHLGWEELMPPASGGLDLVGHWLIVGNPRGHGAALGREIARRGGTFSLVDGPLDLAGTSLPSGPARGVVWLAALESSPPEQETLGSLERAHSRLLGSLVRLCRSLESREPDAGPRLWIVTRGAQPVREGHDRPCLTQAPCWGFGRAFGLEKPGLWGGLIDLDPCPTDDEMAVVAETIGRGEAEGELAFRGTARFVCRLRPMPESSSPERGFKIRPEGTYLITGGLGDLGLQVAGLLADRGARRLVLAGRNGLPDRATWDEAPEGTRTRRRIEAVRELEARGATILLAEADAADPVAISRLFEDLRRNWPPLRGIVHAAGIVRPAAIGELDDAAIAATLRPKADGGWLLHQHSRELPLDFFVLFSSIASVLGSAKLVDYSAANAFLDALAHHRRAAGLPAQAINFGPWARVGMATEDGRSRLFPLIGLRALDPQTALGLLESAAGAAAAQAVIVDADWATFGEVLDRGRRGRLLEHVPGAVKRRQADPARVGRLDGMLPGERGERLLNELLHSIAAVLHYEPEQIDVDRPLIGLGLDSLTALELKSGVERSLGLVVPLSALLQGSTLRDLAMSLDEAVADQPLHSASSDVAADADGLSVGEELLWYAQQFAALPGAYNAGGAGKCRGPLDAVALGRAVRRLVERHEALRTIYPPGDRGPSARVLGWEDALARGWDVVEHSDVSGCGDSDLSERLGRLISEPFDLEHGPLFRVRVLSRSSQEHVVLIACHHIISDFWSLAVLVDELARFYRGEREGRPSPLPPLVHSYRDFRAWQAGFAGSQAEARQCAYWSRQLSGPLPVLELPADRVRPRMPRHEGARLHVSADPGLSEAITRLARENDASLYATLLAAFQVLLAGYTGESDIIVGSPVSGRTRPEWQGLIGYFVNLLPMRSDLSGNPPFREFLARVRQTVVEALEHQDLPFGRLLDRLKVRPDLSRSPVFQVMYIHQKAHRLDDLGLSPFALGHPGVSMRMHGLRVESATMDRSFSLYDLTLLTARERDRIAMAFEYSTELFDPATIAALADSFLGLLRMIVEDPARPVLELSFGRTGGPDAPVPGEWGRSVPVSDDQGVALDLLTEEELDALIGSSCLGKEISG